MSTTGVGARTEHLRRWAPAITRVAILGCLALAFTLQTSQQWRTIQEGTQGYLIGDWTISYAGGLVRRGFSGWLLLSVAPEASSALPVLWATQTMLYLVIFGVVARWTMLLPAPLAWAPFLLSPAFLLFGLNDFGGTHRKEIIVLAGLFLLAEAVRSGRAVAASTVVASLLFAVGVVSHEANVFLLAPLLVLLRWAAADGAVTERFGRWATIGSATTAALGLVLAVVAPGTAEQQRAICTDLLRRGFDEDLCRGSLSYIGEPASGQVMRVLLDALPGYSLYVLPALFALIPFLWSPWARAHRRLLIASVAPIVPLFLIAIDWGRWIMWAAVVATVLTVVGSTRASQPPRRMPIPVLVLFVVGWSLPHASSGPPSAGLGELPASILWAIRALARVVVG